MQNFYDQVTDFLTKINDKVHGWLWFIMAAAIAVLVLLVVILLIAIACKNAKIRKLKRAAEAERSAKESFEATQAQEAQEPPVYEAEPMPMQLSAPQETEQQPAPQETTAQPTPQEKTSQPAPQRTAKQEPVVKPVAQPRQTSTVAVQTENGEMEEYPVTRSGSDTPRIGGSAKYVVKYERAKESWVIKKDGVDRVIRRVSTKEEALSIARALCKNNDASLVVHKKDGKFQKQ